MPSVTSEIIKAIKNNFWLLLAFSAILTVFGEAFPNFHGNLAGSFGATVILIYFFHRQVLFDLRIPVFGKPVAPDSAKVPENSMVRFILVSVFFIQIPLVAAVAAATKWETVHGGFESRQFVANSMVISAVLLWILLSVFGTLLPAAASRQPFSVPRAWQAGRKTGLVVAFQLLVFVGLSYAAVFALAMLVTWAFGSTLDAPPLSYAVEIIFGALFLLPSLMTVVILVRAFKRAYPMSSV